MDVWKIVAGAAAGVGVLTLSPLFGPVLTITAAGAALGAGGGAAAGGTYDWLRGRGRSKTQPARPEEEHLRAHAELHGRSERLQEKLRRMQQRVGALFAVGFAVAGADGPITPEEREIIQDFACGASAQWHSEALRRRVEAWATLPPGFGEAMRIVDAVGDPTLDELVDQMIDLAILLDDRETPDESAWREAWHRHREARRQEIA